MDKLFSPVFRSVRLLSRRQRVSYFGLIAARVGTNFLDVAGLAGVALFGTMVASGLTGARETSFASVPIPLSDSSAYLWVISAVVALFLAKSIFATILLRANGFFLASVESQASSEVLEFIFGDDLARVKRFSPAQIQWSVSSSTAMAFSNLLTNFNVLVTETSLFLFIFIAFAVVDFQTALLITLYFLVLIGLFQWVVNRRLVKAGQLLTESSKEVTKVILDLSRAFRELVVLSRVPAFFSVFRRFRRLEARTFARVRFFDGSPRFFVESALMLGVMALVGWQFVRGNLSEGLTVTAVFMAGGVRMMGALLPLQNAVSWMKVNGPQAKDSQDILEESRQIAVSEDLSSVSGVVVGEIPREEATRTAATAEPLAVRLSQVSFQYPDGESPAVQDISLEIEPGSIAAFVGPSGAGKTTIVDLILGLFSPQHGVVSVGEQSPRYLRAIAPGAISYVPQKPGMVTGTVAENVALGISSDGISIQRVEEVLRSVGLWDELAPREGALSDIGSHADGLSGGQLQRLGLARALYSSPRLIVLDEATSALDAGAEAEVVRYIESLRGSVTIIIIAHRLSTIQRVDRVFVVEDGKIAGSGTFSEVRKSVPLIEKYVKLMSFD